MILGFIDSKRRFQPTADRPLTFAVKGRQHALNLDWASFKTEAEAKAHAKKAKKPSFIFNKDTQQAGFTNHPDHRRGREVNAAAAMIARKIGRTPHAAGIYPLEGMADFPDRDTWFWIVEIRQGQIVRDEVVEKPEAVIAADEYLARNTPIELILPEPFLPATPTTAKVASERLSVALDPKYASLLTSVTRDYSVLRRMRLGQVSAWWVVAGVVLSFGSALSFGLLNRRVEVRTVTKETTVYQDRLYVQPTRAVADPAAFLIACDQAYSAAAKAMPLPTALTVTCSAPNGSSAGWTLSLVQLGATPQTHTVSLAMAPHQLIPSGDSGIPADQVYEAIKRALPPGLVTVTSKSLTQTLAAPVAPKPSTAPTVGGSSGVIPPSRTAPTGTPTPASNPTGAAETGTIRSITQAVLTSTHNPRSWASVLARTPFAIETVTRDVKGTWVVTGRIL